MSTKILVKFLSFFLLFVFFTVVGFGLSHSLGMEMKSDGTMGQCFFTGTAELCPMTVVAHIAAWQELFVATPPKIIATSLLVILLIAASASIWSRTFFWREWLRRAIAPTLYLRAHPLLSLYNPFRELFSRGILHPRIYSHTAF